MARATKKSIITKIGEGIASGGLVVVESEYVSITQRYQQPSVPIESALAPLLFAGLAGVFVSLSVVFFLQGDLSWGVGFLGPALASVVGAVGIHLKKR